MKRAVRSALAMVLAVGSLLMPIQGRAQTTGTNANLLQQALMAAAQGQCPDDIMSPLLKGTCEQQMAMMGQLLSQKGKISRTEFLGTQHTQMGMAEVYRVHFSSGQMIWMINTGPDGKIVVLFSPG
jgi:hypothetical protein